MERPVYIVFNAPQTLFESIACDLVTFGFLLLCVYVSRDSLFWSFVTGTLFLVSLSAEASFEAVRRRKQSFRSRAALPEWANALPDDKTENDRTAI